MPSLVACCALVIALALPGRAAAATEPPPEAPTAKLAAVDSRPSPLRLGALQLATGAAAAVISVPASVGLAAFLGTLSNGLVLAALPAVLTFVALPPLAVTFAAWWVGEQLSPGASRLTPALWTTLGAQVLVLAGALLLGVHGQNLGDLALLTLAEAAVLGGVSVGTLRLWMPARPEAQSPLQARLPAFDPSRPAPLRALTLPVASWSF